MKTKMITLCLALVSLGAFAQNDSTKNKLDQSAVTFKDAKLGAAYKHYIQLKNSLVASNSTDAKKDAGELQKALKEISGSTVALEFASKIAGSTDLKAQREVFSKLSNEITILVKGGKLSAGTLYLEYCPMANGNTGAYWLSNEKEIKNPYFGNMMLKCGSVKETIQ